MKQSGRFGGTCRLLPQTRRLSNLDIRWTTRCYPRRYKFSQHCCENLRSYVCNTELRVHFLHSQVQEFTYSVMLLSSVSSCYTSPLHPIILLRWYPSHSPSNSSLHFNVFNSVFSQICVLFFHSLYTFAFLSLFNCAVWISFFAASYCQGLCYAFRRAPLSHTYLTFGHFRWCTEERYEIIW
jgi:hypothetical protein